MSLRMKFERFIGRSSGLIIIICYILQLGFLIFASFIKSDKNIINIFDTAKNNLFISIIILTCIIGSITTLYSSVLFNYKS